MNYLDEEVIGDLEGLKITFSILPELEHEKLVDSINGNIPFSGSQIAWSKLQNSINFDSSTSINPLLLLTQEINKTNTEKMYFVGDSCSVAYSVGRESLGEVLKVFSELPQHTYIVPEPMTWIACLSFEGYIDFAKLLAK
ncbi:MULTISPECIES: hypothetical protein [unclassified Pseudomonas]|uniref:hypothetical protein n=1 Tax=unclassified Pseudomonas TaxID=196821 RepID=UPI000D0D3787|nr:MULTISPECIES: hypothetical protein [unclassified Pseudomonas]PSL90883.1 hypothetical protein C7U57_27780 [Pseudomonas sp. R9.37]TVT89017.1 hypothetical protein FPT15_21875 [Pseudomonas sp. RGB]